MTAPSADTAELPRVADPGVVSGTGALPAPPRPVLHRVPLTVPALPAAGPVVRCRAELRAERRQARRHRRRYAALGLAVLALSLAATVAVLDLIH